MIKNLIFDFGGVVIDADLPRSIQCFESLGLKNVAEKLNLYKQNDYFLGIENGELDRAGFVAKICEEAGREVTDSQVEEAWMAIVAGVQLYKLDALVELRKRFRLYMLSNINPFVMDWADTSAFSEYGKPVGDYFDRVFASYRMGMTKPSREIFLKVVEETGILPQETLFVDDGLRNVETASELGFHVYQPKNCEDWRPALKSILGNVF